MRNIHTCQYINPQLLTALLGGNKQTYPEPIYKPINYPLNYALPCSEVISEYALIKNIRQNINPINRTINLHSLIGLEADSARHVREHLAEEHSIRAR